MKLARIPLVGLFAVSLLGALPACSKKIKLGVSLPLSGVSEKRGTEMLRAIELFVEKTNSAGGIDGKSVALVVRDDKDDPAEGKKVAKEFVDDSSIVAVIGNLNSPVAMAAAEEYDKSDLISVTPVSTNSDLSEKTKHVFMLNRDGVYQGHFMADYIKGVMGKSRVLILAQESRYGARHVKGFEARAPEIGLTIQRMITYKNDDLKKEGYLDSVLGMETGFDAVVLMHDENLESGRNLLMQLDKSTNAALKEATMLAPESFINPEYLKPEMEQYTIGLYVCSPFFWEGSNAITGKLKEAYEHAYKETPSFGAAMAYDAAILLSEAARAKGTDRKAIHEYLTAQKRKDLQAKKTNPVVGGTGELVFTDNRFMDRDLYVANIEHGRYKMAYVQMATVKEPYVIKQLPERIAAGSVIELAGVPYHLVDVVFVGLDVLRINQINGKDMKFEAEFFMWYKWMGKNVDVSQIEPTNGSGDLKVMLLKENMKSAKKYRAFRMKSTFNVLMDFADFPWDTQYLEMSFANKSKNNTHILLVPDSRHMTSNELKAMPMDWKFKKKHNYTGLVQYDSTFGDPDYRMGIGYKSRVLFSSLNFQVDVVRVIVGYIFTMFMPIIVILGAAFLVVSAPVEELKGRMPLAMTALLTVVLSRMGLASQIPAVGYMMKADHLFILAFFYVISIIIVISLIIWLMSKKNDTLARKIHMWFVKVVSPMVAVAIILRLVMN